MRRGIEVKGGDLRSMILPTKGMIFRKKNGKRLRVYTLHN